MNQIKEGIKKLLEQRQNKRYEKELSAQKLSYEEWAQSLEEDTAKQKAKGTVSQPASNNVQTVFYEDCDSTFGRENLSTDYAIFHSSKGELSADALKQIPVYFEQHPECDLLYGDEDVLTADGHRTCPWWKPDWSPDTFLNGFYFGGMFAVRTKAVQKEYFAKTGDWKENIYKLCFELICSQDGFSRRIGNVRKIGHISRVLYHGNSADAWKEWRNLAQSQSEYALAQIENADKAGNMTKDQMKNETPLISVIIPSKENLRALSACVQSFQKYAGTCSYEILVVDNGSREEEKCVIEEFCETHKIHYLYHPMQFNFSAMCNIGAENARGEYLLFLNDDVEAVQEGFLDEMLLYAKRSYVGAVGAKLCYPSSHQIQHAGITSIQIGPVHKLQFMDDEKEQYFGRNRMAIDVLAVTAACLLISKEKFKMVGGFDEEFKVAFNDVALGFALEKAGFYNVVCNQLYLYHHESLSRGSDSSAEKLNRLMEERERLYRLFPEYEGKDPYYNRNLANDILDTGMNMHLQKQTENMQMVSLVYRDKAGLREMEENECLKVSIEYAADKNEKFVVRGYSFIVGSNNARYKKQLVLMPVVPEGKPNIYVNLKGLIRTDVAENTVDIENAQLSGFSVEIGTANLPKGRYRICIYAKDTCSNMKLLKRTNRYLIHDSQG